MFFTTKATITVGVGETQKGEPISIGQQHAALRDAMKLLAGEFGGVTLRAAKGAYVMHEDGRLVTEDAAELVVYTALEKDGDDERNEKKINKISEALRNTLDQESVLVSFEEVSASLV